MGIYVYMRRFREFVCVCIWESVYLYISGGGSSGGCVVLWEEILRNGQLSLAECTKKRMVGGERSHRRKRTQSLACGAVVWGIMAHVFARSCYMRLMAVDV